MSYRKGENLSCCPVCGKQYYAGDFRRRWDGLWVCRYDYEERHPQDFVRGKADDMRPAVKAGCCGDVETPCVGFEESSFTFSVTDDVLIIPITKRSAGPVVVTYTTSAGTTARIEITTATYNLELSRVTETASSNTFTITLSDPFAAEFCLASVATVTIPPVYYTSTLYPVRPEDELAVSGVVTAASFRSVLTDYMSMEAAIVQFQIGGAYFPIDANYKQDGQPDNDFHEDMELSAEVIQFQVGAVYFPIDANYKQDGQPDEGFHEDMELAADVIQFQIGGVYFPIDYLNWPEEELDLEADIVEFTIEAA